MIEDPLIGTQLDEYHLEALLGQGGMARVYRALDARLKRYAAVKVIGASYRSDPEYLKRFEQEAQAIARLEHPHIVHLYRYGEADGLLYMAMQYIEGSDLGRVLQTYEENGEFIQLAEASRILHEVCEALDYSHSQGVIHRDIKPSNIMVMPNGRSILTDFGLMLFTQSGTMGQVFGTPQYIAPEQAISSAGAVPQSDLYAMGVILYRMITGVLPFEGNDMVELAMRHLTEPPRAPRELRPEIGPQAEAVILQALAKEPKDRHPTGAALAEALDRALQTAPTKPVFSATNSLSVVQRVSLSMEELPPIPAAVSPGFRPFPPPEPTSPIMAPTSGVIRETEWGERGEERGERGEGWKLVLAGQGPLWVGVGMLLLLLLGVGLFWWNRQGDEPTVADQLPTAEVITDSLSATVEVIANITVENSFPTLDGTPAAPVTTTLETVVTNSVGLTVWLPVAMNNNSFILPAGPIETAVSTPVPTQTVVATPLPATAYTVFIAQEGDTLYLLNQGSQALPLAGLSLDMQGNSGIVAEWNLGVLDSKTCILIYKDDKNPDPPPPLCDRAVRSVVIFEWRDNFTVEYNGTAVGDCRTKQDACIVSIPAP